MNSALGIAVVLLGIAWCLFVISMFFPEISRTSQSNIDLEGDGIEISPQARGLAGDSSSIFEPVRIQLYDNDELEIAGIRYSSSALFGITLAVMFVAMAFVTLGSSSLLLGILTAVTVPIGIKIYIGIRADRVRQKFEGQLDEALTLMSSALKSGMNVPTALQSVSREMAAPMGDELTRIVNETAIGRDMIEGMRETSERMQSRSFLWVSEAIAIQRESGGRLSEILDRVVETLSRRHELNERVRSLSADGRLSAVVLLLLPVFVVILFSLINSDFIAPLWSSSTGRFLMIVAAILYIVGGLWLRAIAKVKL